MDGRVPDNPKCRRRDGLTRPPAANFLPDSMVLAAAKIISALHLDGGVLQFASAQDIERLYPANLRERAGDTAKYFAIELVGGCRRWGQRGPCPRFLESPDAVSAIALCARRRRCRKCNRYRRFYLPVVNSKLGAEPYAATSCGFAHAILREHVPGGAG